MLICFQITEAIVCDGKSDNNIPANRDRAEVKLLNDKGGRNMFEYVRITSFPQSKLPTN